MTESKPLSGRTALVTGASRGIGAATAQALAEAGAHVILVARKVKALEAVEDAIHASGGSSTIAPLDLTEADAVTRLAAAIAGRWDTLDILCISAAYLPELTPISQVDPKQFNQALLTNVVATQALIAGFDPLLRKAGAGRVIGLTSSVGASPRAFWGAYGSTKAAFDNILETYGPRSKSSARCASPSSIRARPGPTCAPAPIRAKTRSRSNRQSKSRRESSNCWSRTSPPDTANGWTERFFRRNSAFHGC
ncbi:SDR family NAD(P)-dependent oxidoreductase [Erythrobacter sp. JK5]|nr:SDR family NAD(P)-dependent oxidoreductase [Erythrobacter sp. JK5]